MNNTSNVTYLPRDNKYNDVGYWEIVFVLLRLCLGLCTIVVNVLVISVYGVRRRFLLSSPPNHLLLNLSLCYFFNGLVILLRSSFVAYYKFADDSESMTLSYRVLIDIITEFFVKTDVMHLCGIALDRYFSIFYALKYQTVVNSKAVRRYIIVAWLGPLATSSIQLIWLYPVLGENMSDESIKNIERIEIWYSLGTFLIFLAIPIVLLAIAYIRMFHEIRRLLRQLPGKHVVEMLPKQRRVLTIFCSMYVNVVVLALPYFTLRLYLDMRTWLGLPVNVSQSVVYLVIVFQNLTSIINPLLYTTSTSDVKSFVREVALISARGIRRFSTDRLRKFSSPSKTRRKVGRIELQPFMEENLLPQRPSRVRKVGIVELPSDSNTDVY